MELYATCVTGLEAALAEELHSFDTERIRPLTGGVSFEASLKGAYQTLLWSRVASRILLVMDRISAKSSEALYAGAYDLDWENVISPGASIAIYARGTNAELRDTRFSALRIKDAICDRMRDKGLDRPDVEVSDPDIRIQITIHADKASVYLDLSGRSLEDRGYREICVSRSHRIHETVAAAMLLEAQWGMQQRSGSWLFDPMCASGELVIEAALIAADRAPGLTRRTWGFEKWKGHDEALWLELLDNADDRAEMAPKKQCITAFDERDDELFCAQKRARSAGVLPYIKFTAAQEEFLAQAGSDVENALFASCLFVTEDPYPAMLPSQYAHVAEKLLSVPSFKTAAVLAHNEEADVYLGRTHDKEFSCKSGQEDRICLIYDLSKHTMSLEEVNVRGQRIATYDASAQQFADRLNKMRKQRFKWAEVERISAFRVYDADLPDYNLALDVYEGAGKDRGRKLVHIAEYAPPKKIDPAKAARRVVDALNITSATLEIPSEDIFVKRRLRAKGGSQYAQEKQRSEKDKARRNSGLLVTQENGLLFQVDLASKLDTGLFLDHRDVRLLLGKLAKDKSFLNLFAYTCTASVYGAAGGAKFTTSVDLSNTYLDWGKKNFELNGLLNDHQEFIRADCVEWVTQTRHSKLRWDLIFVDPPTFSNSSKMGKRAWDVQRDHAELLIGASRLLTRGGAIVFSCNLRGFVLDKEKLVKAGVEAVDITAKTIPIDFERNAKIHHCFLLRRTSK